MTAVATVVQRLNEVWRAFRQNDIAFEDDGVTGEMRCFFFHDVDQVGDVLPDRALAVFIEGLRKPECAAVRQRTETGIEVVKTRIDQFHGNDEAGKNIRNRAVRLDVGAKLVAAKERVTAK